MLHTGIKSELTENELLMSFQCVLTTTTHNNVQTVSAPRGAIKLTQTCDLYIVKNITAAEISPIHTGVIKPEETSPFR